MWNYETKNTEQEKKWSNKSFFFEMISQLDVPGHEGSEVGRASFGRKRNSPKMDSGVVIIKR